MSTKYPGGFITKSPPIPSGPFENSTARGVWTLDQAMQLKRQGLWPTAGNIAPLVIGQAYAGGFFAGQISTAGTGVANFNIVVGPLSTAEATRQWQTFSADTPGTSSLIDGPANSAAMNSGSNPAAQFCEGLTVGGFSDWYMPAQNELEVCYFNLKPSTSNNVTFSGSNPNAVPTRGSNYTTGNPAQTSATAFRTGGAEAFSAAIYWSSTQSSSMNAQYLSFTDGRLPSIFKTSNYRVRAIRRIPV